MTITNETPMPAAMQGHKLPHSQIHPDPTNVRGDDRADIESLAQSILINGLVQPIVLDEDNTIIAGHRRHAAVGYLIEQGAISELYLIPVTYYESHEGGGGSTQLMLVENLQRVDLDPIEEASGYQRLVDEYGLKHADVGERLGRSGSLVSSRIRLLRLPELAQTMLKMGALKLDVAEALIPLAKYPDIVTECLNLGLTADQIQTRVNRMKQAEKLVLVKEYIDNAGAYAVLDRSELSSLNLVVDHQQVAHDFTSKAELGAKIVADEVYFLTVNYRDEIQIHHTLEAKPVAEKGEALSPEAQTRKEQLAAEKEQTKIRRAQVMEIINTASLAKAEIEMMLDRVLIAGLTEQQLRFVATLLGIPKEEVPEHSYSTEAQRAYDYGKALLTLLQAGGKRATRVRFAIILGTQEIFTSAKPGPAYVEVLEIFGYRVNRKGKLVPIEEPETDADAEMEKVLDDGI